jgi:hypothetical protein
MLLKITYHRFSSWTNRKGGNKMGNYNDFDLDIKKVQGENDIGPASITTTIILSIKTCTEALSCDGGCSGSDTCGITCGGVGASCSGHCR